MRQAPKPIAVGPKLTKQTLNEGLRSQIRFEKTWMDAIADFCTAIFGTIWFLLLNACFFVGWVALNSPTSGLGFTPFDPYPFGLLTTVMPVEAIFLSIFILISQNRQSKIADIRQRVNFEVDVRAEEEVTEVLKLGYRTKTEFGTVPDGKENRYTYDTARCGKRIIMQLGKRTYPC